MIGTMMFVSVCIQHTHECIARHTRQRNNICVCGKRAMTPTIHLT